MTHRRPLAVLFASLFATALAAQQGAPPPPAPGAAARMAPLAFLVGEWEGEAWIQMGPGRRDTVRQQERVEWKVGEEVLLIQGLGRTVEANTGEPRTVHDALATIAWDPERQRHVMWTYVGGRGAGSPEVSVEPGRVVWGFESPGGRVRFTIQLDEQGRWVETGERSADGGRTWQPFFGMTLTRK
jgi:hypothetical protein